VLYSSRDDDEFARTDFDRSVLELDAKSTTEAEE
jgi:hypothetical protein